jgi:hypothetical protein
MNLENIKEINNKKSIDQITNDLLNSNPKLEYIDIIEVQILMKIRKVKIQFYLKEQFEKLRNQLIYSKNEFYKNKKKVTYSAVEERIKHYLTYEMLKGKKIETISEIVKQKSNTILSLIHRKDPKMLHVHEKSTINEAIWLILSDFLINSYDLKIRQGLKEESNNKNTFKWNKKKFSPSSGNPGNYGKLIYIRTKS